MMNKTIKILLVLVGIASAWILSVIAIKTSYRFRVNAAIASQVQQDLKGDELSNGVITEDYFGNDISHIAQWGDVSVRVVSRPIESSLEGGGSLIEPNNVIETSSDKGRTWTRLYQSGSPYCEYGVLYGSQLICLDRGEYYALSVFRISRDGKHSQKLLSSVKIDQIKKVYRKGNEIWIIWLDRRATFPNIYAFIPIPHSHSTYFGPYLIMAGRLNCDTLHFAEYVIKYDADDL